MPADVAELADAYRDLAAGARDRAGGGDRLHVVVDGERFDVLGTTGSIAKQTDGWTIEDRLATRVAVDDSPFGPFVVTLRWREGAWWVDFDDTSDVELSMRLEYPVLLDWLWGGWCLGHLLFDGSPFRSTDLFVLSAIDGLVKAPTVGPSCTPQLVGCLTRLAHLRRPPAACDTARPVGHDHPGGTTP